MIVSSFHLIPLVLQFKRSYVHVARGHGSCGKGFALLVCVHVGGVGSWYLCAPQIQLLKTNIQCIASEWEETLSSQREALQVAEQSVVDLRTTLSSILESIPDRVTSQV